MEVELPDGTILEFPEGTPEDVMRSAVQKYIAKQDGKKKTQSATDDLVTQAQAAFAAGNDAEGKRLLTEANRMAIDAGNVPEGFVADPRTGGFSDLARDPSIPEMGKLESFGFGAMQGLGANFGDEAIGKTLSLLGEDQQFATERAREMERRASENPMSYYGGYIPGAIASALSLGKATGMTGATTNGGMALQGAGLGGIQGALSGAGAAEDGGRMVEALKSGLIGAGLGAAAPYAANKVSKIWEAIRAPSALRAAAKGAPTTEELRAAGNAAYKAVDDAGVVVKPEAFSGAISGITDDMAKAGMKPGLGESLSPKSIALSNVMQDMATDPKYAAGVPFSDIDTLRKVAQAPASDIANGLESSLGMRAISGIDDFVNSLTPDQVAAGNADEIPGLINTARGIWSKMLKSDMIDTAIEKSKNYASGEASGLANRFRTILNSDKLSRGFTEAEKVAMRRVINGTMPERALRYLGSGIGQIASGVGGAGAGSALGPFGYVLGAGIGTGISAVARKGGEAIANRNAELVRALIANGGKANLPAVSGGTKAVLEALIRGSGASTAPGWAN